MKKSDEDFSRRIRRWLEMTLYSLRIHNEITNLLVHFLLTPQTHNHLSPVYWHDILLHDNALLWFVHCRLSLSLTVVISRRRCRISTMERDRFSTYTSVSTSSDMNFTNLYLAKIKEHLMNTHQQYGQNGREEKEKKMYILMSYYWGFFRLLIIFFSLRRMVNESIMRVIRICIFSSNGQKWCVYTHTHTHAQHQTWSKY